MKTAEEWIQENNPLLLVGGGTYNGILERYKQIQLDAMKEGMRRAAGMDRLARHTNASHEDVKQIADNILTAAEQLTERDLA
jgi:cytochrome c553